MGSMRTRRNPKRGGNPSWDATLFVFSNDATILLQFPAKCKTVFSGFYTAVPVSMGSAVFFILSILTGYSSDGLAVKR